MSYCQRLDLFKMFEGMRTLRSGVVDWTEESSDQTSVALREYMPNCRTYERLGENRF